ncbi:uncharacterized protein LOC118766197 [Octopus sinensis]|uniref:Uncharacterized protein LOC118766197 n=1 Tax=Octopus sinensis TaxID=2607531 RepID=A0A7E6FC91_9MOLL|nr:uncharacterized protein LOC118766197 [Octopus sinensis]
MEDLLTETCSMLNSLLSKIDTLFANIASTIITIQNILSKNNQANTTDNTNLLAGPPQSQRTTNDEETKTDTNQEEPLKPQDWNKLLNQRKYAYWKSIRCKNRANIYQNWRDLKNPILPRKFLIKEIRGETLEETTIRATLALCRLETEISLLQTRSAHQEDKIKTIDTVIMAEITEKNNKQNKEKLQQLWKEDTKREEERSRIMWTKQHEWFLNYEKNYGEESIMKTKKLPKQMNRYNKPTPQTYWTPRHQNKPYQTQTKIPLLTLPNPPLTDTQNMKDNHQPKTPQKQTHHQQDEHNTYNQQPITLGEKK